MTGHGHSDEQVEYGQLERDGDRSLLRYERALAHPPQKVWRALTEPAHLKAWFPSEIHGELAPGAAVTFVFPEHEAPPMDGRVTEFDPPNVIELSWGPDLLRFELEPSGDGTHLTFTVLLEELGKAARDGAGWHACLDQLACELAGEPPAWSPADRSREVRGAYVERFGPEASTLGPPREWEEVHGAA